MTRVQTDDPLVGRLLESRYRLTHRLARGGMATVYRGVDDRLDRPVAVKVMHRGLADDPDFVARFTREARSAARLSAPEVVAVYDQGHDELTGAAYLVMEYVDGRDLRAVLTEQGPLPAERALRLLEPVLRALAAAHRAGIVHRDVKPENVLLADDGRVKVADFGLAKAVETSELTTASGLLLGTVAYLAPEQVEHGCADARSDVYAAGVMLWEALTGRPPYTAQTPIGVAFAHVHSDVPPPSTAAAGVPPGLDALVVRATRRDPALRPADAGVFLAELRGLRGDHPARQDTLVAPLPRVPGGAPAARHDTRPVTAGPGTAAAGTAATGTTATGTAAAGTAATGTGMALVASPPPAHPLPGPVRPSRRRRGRLLPWLLVLAVLGGTGGWYLGIARYTAAPALLGRPAAEAGTLLAARGLREVQQPSRFDETVPAGQVLDQQPGVGGRVRKGGAVTVVLSQGPDRREVPTLAGDTQSAAADALTGRGLRVGQVRAVYSPAPVGTVVSSDPAAGRSMRPDGAVDLVLSKGLEMRTVPGVADQPQDAAQAALGKAGFAAGTTQAFDEQVPAGTVVSQSPAGGQQAARGSTVTLVVSKGPDLQVVPDVGGLSKQEAVGQLRALGLSPRVIQIPGPGTVRSVDPATGTKVRRGSAVTLYIF